MTDARTIQPIGPFNATLTPPGSKSLTNRALLLAALAEGESTLRGVLDADDTRRMLAALRALGVDVQASDEGRTVQVAGIGGRLGPAREPLHLGNAGTAYRFLTAALCLGQGEYELTGIERMHHRPIGELVEALRRIGADIDYLNEEGYPPLRVRGGTLQGGKLRMAPTLSSQYISALLQIAPLCEQGLTLEFDGPITSRPYVEMTLALMARYGVEAQPGPGMATIGIAPGRYKAIEYHIEPDASNASYFLAAAAIIPGSKCIIQGLGAGSLQGDAGFAHVLRQMGAGIRFDEDAITVMAPPLGQRLRGIDVDLNHMPDMAQTLACAALFADGPTVIRNVGNLRVKETDRLAALEKELAKLGANVTIKGDDICVEPPPGHAITPAAIDTYDDHRMAMSFAVIGLAAEGVTINDPGCVNKTFPDFFDYLDQLAQPPSGVR